MKELKLTLMFILLNFGGLFFGMLLMNNGPTTEWYLELNKAPWTPPSWVFGAAWTTIMVFFSVYLALAFAQLKTTNLSTAFAISFILNVGWNYIFFNLQWVFIGLIIIFCLALVIIYMFFKFKLQPKFISILLLPYILWLCIATSLNAYIVLNN